MANRKYSDELKERAVRLAIELAAEVRRLRDELASARSEVATGKDLIRRQQDYVALVSNEVLAYLDAGRQQRHEIIRRWEHEFSQLRAGRRP